MTGFRSATDPCRLPCVPPARPPANIACGFCHLPDGAGRPENAKLAGLPEDYIVRQVLLMHEGARAAALPDYAPLQLMRASLEGLDAEAIRSAARYFAQQPAHSFERVIETQEAPAVTARCFVLTRTTGPGEALRGRIVEVVDDFERFELRDPRAAYTAYVPAGSLRRGRALATRGSGRLAACASCHGPDLKGGAGPPLAGRFAGYLVRQLYAFKSGARQGQAAQRMEPVAALLSDGDIIETAAYAASLRP